MPRRDFVILPLLCLATLLLLVGVPELLAEHAFYEHKTDACLRPDPVLGSRALPNCKAQYKSGEGPWAENDYNECGYRSSSSCLTKAPSLFRIALIGSSTSMGYLVPYDQTFAVRSEKLLTAKCGRAVEFQSMGGLGYQWARMEARMDEALKLKPDLVIATLTPFDVRQPLEAPAPSTPTPPQGPLGGLVSDVRGWVQGSSLWLAVLHYRAELPVTYLHFFLRDPERAGYLDKPITPFWQQQLGYTKTLIDHLAAKARAGHVPMMLVFVPLRAQAVLLKHQAEFPQNDALAFDDAIADMAQQAGIRFIDATPMLAAAPNLDPLFYAVDDHITGAGSAMLAKEVSSAVIAGHYSGLVACGSLASASATG